tara:strand:- start:10 stop:885 length:876 start_codon:yes stop_codon:yes gene_type:complete
MIYYFKALRPWQWLKNTLIFIPYILGKESYGIDVLEVILIFMIFSLFVSSTYIFNDIKDIELDKLHPSKKYRPITSGIIDTKNANYFSRLILTSTFLVSYYVNPTTFFYFLIYALLTFLYTNKAKYIFLLDTLFISLMFTIRVAIGGVVAKVNPSVYLLCTIFLISCILSTSKKISILNTVGIDNKSNYYQLLKEQNQKINFKILYILFCISSIGTLLVWFLNLSYEGSSILKKVFLLISLFGVAVFLNYVLTFSMSGNLEDFSKEIFKNKILLTLSSLIVISFYLGYFLF